MNEDWTKWCPGCRQHLPVEDWHRHKGTKDGLQYRCKTCQRQLVTSARNRRKKAEQQAMRRLLKEQREAYDALLREALEEVGLA